MGSNQPRYFMTFRSLAIHKAIHFVKVLINKVKLKLVLYWFITKELIYVLVIGFKTLKCFNNVLKLELILKFQLNRLVNKKYVCSFRLSIRTWDLSKRELFSCTVIFVLQWSSSTYLWISSYVSSLVHFV